MKIITLIYLIILTLGFETSSKQTVFIGEIITDSENKNELKGFSIEFRIDTIMIAKTKIQENGSFRLSASIEKEFDVFYRGVGVNDSYALTLKPSDKDTVLLNFKIPKDYNKYLGKAICPKCRKYDQTIPIVYGLKEIFVYAKNQPPYKTYKGYGKKEIYDEGCSEAKISPRYFCKTDKIRF